MNHHHYFIQSLSNRMDAYVDVEDQHWGGAAPDQFSCTQRPWNKDDPAWINSKDINVEGFSINAKGKPLFENADLKESVTIRSSMAAVTVCWVPTARESPRC